MIMTTTSLDRAAFYLAFGSKLLSIEEVYPNNSFTIQTNRLLFWYEIYIGWIPYEKFCKARRMIKKLARKKAGLPVHFTGDSRSHYTFGDLAIVDERKKSK